MKKEYVKFNEKGLTKLHLELNNNIKDKLKKIKKHKCSSTITDTMRQIIMEYKIK